VSESSAQHMDGADGVLVDVHKCASGSPSCKMDQFSMTIQTMIALMLCGSVVCSRLGGRHVSLPPCLADQGHRHPNAASTNVTAGMFQERLSPRISEGSVGSHRSEGHQISAPTTAYSLGITKW
jgi:hypothetical protein